MNDDEPHFGFDCIPDAMPCHIYDEEKPFKFVFLPLIFSC